LLSEGAKAMSAQEFRPNGRLLESYYPPAVSDIWHTLWSTREFEAERRELISRQWEALRREQPEQADDIMDDVAYYGGLEAIHLWSFCLWRAHGLLEAMVDARCLPDDLRRRRGVGAKLALLQSRGHSVSSDHLEALAEWTALRNRITHMPQKHVDPPMLDEEELTKFARLAEVILVRIGYEK
jgi:hypothetical protein